MIIVDSEDYIKTHISKYLEDMLCIFEYQPIPLYLLYSIITKILSNTFLLMVGMIEKKLEMISWHIAQYDYNYRHKLLTDRRDISARLDIINSLYIYLNNKCVTKNIMENKNYKNSAYQKIIDLFANSMFINYTNSDFLQFKQECSKQLNKDFLEKLYKDTLQHRHSIAHNINSVYRENATFSELNENEISYNWYARFMILLLIDNALIDGFSEYNKIFKIRWY